MSMDIQTFYQTYLGEHELVRASLFNSVNFTSMDELIDYKLKELSDAALQAEIFEHLSMAEAKLIRRLAAEESHDEVHRVAYNQNKYTTLIDYQYILEDNVNQGVIHEDIINHLNYGLRKTGIFPFEPMYIPDSQEIKPSELSRFDPIFKGPIYWLYNNLTFIKLRKVMSKLNIKSIGQYKDDYLSEVTTHIVTKESLELAISLLDRELANEVAHKVKEDDYLYANQPRWQDAVEMGLLVKVHKDYLIMHEDVLTTLKQIDFKTINHMTTARVSENYNAYRIMLSINGMNEIYREIQLPTRLNLLELEIVISEVFGWQNTGSGDFVTDDEVLTDLESAPKNVRMADVYLQGGPVQYLASSDDYYVVDIEVEDYINIEKALPKVLSYGGPVPIEGIGGIDQLQDILTILQDKNHPDYVSTYAKVRNKNFRERYPVSAVNKQLLKLFNRGSPIT